MQHCAHPIHGADAVTLLHEIWREGRENIFPRALAERFSPAEKNVLIAQLSAASAPPLADVLNPFLESLGVSHTRFYDVRDHGYYMMKSLFGTRDIDQPKLHQLGVQFEQVDDQRLNALAGVAHRRPRFAYDSGERTDS